MPRGDSAPLAPAAMEQPRRGSPPVRLLSDDQIETIHRAALDRPRRDRHGCSLPGGARHLGRGRRHRRGRAGAHRPRHHRGAAIGTAPPNSPSMPAIPSRSSASAATGSPLRRSAGRPTVPDTDRGRRPGTLRGQRQFHPAGAVSSTASTPPAAGRPMRSMFMPRCAISTSCLNKVLLSDKVLFTSSTGRARLFDGIEMARIARGVTPRAVPRRALASTR